MGIPDETGLPKDDPVEVFSMLFGPEDFAAACPERPVTGPDFLPGRDCPVDTGPDFLAETGPERPVEPDCPDCLPDIGPVEIGPDRFLGSPDPV